VNKRMVTRTVYLIGFNWAVNTRLRCPASANAYETLLPSVVSSTGCAGELVTPFGRELNWFHQFSVPLGS
jgi:hypothetical protein